MCDTEYSKNKGKREKEIEKRQVWVFKGHTKKTVTSKIITIITAGMAIMYIAR